MTYVIQPCNCNCAQQFDACNCLPVTLQCRNSGGIASLCGFSELTSPSTPPVKYLNLQLSGGWVHQASGGGFIESTTYSGTCQYSPANCALSSNGQKIYKSVTTGNPLFGWSFNAGWSDAQFTHPINSSADLGVEQNVFIGSHSGIPGPGILNIVAADRGLGLTGGDITHGIYRVQWHTSFDPGTGNGTLFYTISEPSWDIGTPTLNICDLDLADKTSGAHWNIALTPTTLSATSIDSNYPTANQGIALSNADTEENAEARSTASWGNWLSGADSGCIAGIQPRTTGFSFSFNNVQYKCIMSGVDGTFYTVNVHFGRRVYGTTGPFLDFQTIIRTLVIGNDGTGNITGDVPNDYGYQTVCDKATAQPFTG